MAEFVRLEVDGGMGTIRLDRPPMNAISRQVQEELAATRPRRPPATTCAPSIVYGGEKVFAAGADVKEMASHVLRRDGADRAARVGRASVRSPGSPSRPWPRSPATRSAVAWRWCWRGPADRRRQRQAGRARDPARRHSRRRRHAAAGPARRAGPGEGHGLHGPDRRAPTRRSRSAWSTSWCPAADVYARARAYVEQFAHGPALAYAAAKKAIDGGLDIDLRTGLDIESDQFAALFATDDQRIGMASFVEHGPGKAQFTGR